MPADHLDIPLDSVEEAIAAISRGEAVVVVDDANRENEGDLVFAASAATPELVGFMVRHTSGYVCVPASASRLDALGLPPMTTENEDPRGTAYAVSVDARAVTTTGISAQDRSITIRALADPATTPADLTRPGHVVPLRAKAAGVLQRIGHTEATVDLVRLAGLGEVGALCELVNDDGTMMRAQACRAFADTHGLVMISIADLVSYRRRTESQVQRLATTALPTENGQFEAVAYRDSVDGVEHVALVKGEIGDGQDVLVRVHSECLTGDVLASQRCDCGPQLRESLERIATEGRGVLVYLRGHEGRGIGLVHKLQAYQLQDTGVDTVDANLRLGLPADARDFGTGAQILVDLGVRSMRLLTNNPDKRAGLEGFGLSILGRVPLAVRANRHNVDYLTTKRDRMGHHLPDDLFSDQAGAGSRRSASVPDTEPVPALPTRPGRAS